MYTQPLCRGDWMLVHLETASWYWSSSVTISHDPCFHFHSPRGFKPSRSCWLHTGSSLRVSLQRGASVPLVLPTSGEPMAGVLSVDEAGPRLRRTRWVAVRKAAGNPGLVSLPSERGTGSAQTVFGLTTVDVLNEAACSRCWFVQV